MSTLDQETNDSRGELVGIMEEPIEPSSVDNDDIPDRVAASSGENYDDNIKLVKPDLQNYAKLRS